LIDPLIIARAVHLAATTLVAGTILFELVIARPALREGEAALLLPRLRIAALLYSGLAIAALSGFVWFVLFAAKLGGRGVGEVFAGDIGLTVLTQTRFGEVWALRLCCAVAVAVCYPLRDRSTAASLVLLSGTAFLGALAWVGHSGAAPGMTGSVQLAADVLHLIAAGGWLGALVPLAALFAQAGVAETLVVDITRRFSNFGVINVATLAATGLVNAYLLVGSLGPLVTTTYGQALLVKIALFAAMVALASINRLYYLPRLGLNADGKATRGLLRNSMVEIALGLVVLVAVGLLGTLPPAAHEPSHIHVH